MNDYERGVADSIEYLRQQVEYFDLADDEESAEILEIAANVLRNKHAAVKHATPLVDSKRSVRRRERLAALVADAQGA